MESTVEIDKHAVEVGKHGVKVADEIADADDVAHTVADADEILPTAIEGALKLTKGWVCSHAKADVGTVKPKLVSQNTNGSEVKTLLSL